MKKDVQEAGKVLERLGKEFPLQEMKKYTQHAHVSTYKHCRNVAKLSLWISEHLPVEFDRESLLTGAMLHDFYLYDWHEKDDSHRWHGFHHADVALRKARHYRRLNPRTENIIESHMWPLTIRKVPKYRESVVVCLADKICSLGETLYLLK